MTKLTRDDFKHLKSLLTPLYQWPVSTNKSIITEQPTTPLYNFLLKHSNERSFNSYVFLNNDILFKLLLLTKELMLSKANELNDVYNETIDYQLIIDFFRPYISQQPELLSYSEFHTFYLEIADFEHSIFSPILLKHDTSFDNKNILTDNSNNTYFSKTLSNKHNSSDIVAIESFFINKNNKIFYFEIQKPNGETICLTNPKDIHFYTLLFIKNIIKSMFNKNPVLGKTLADHVSLSNLHQAFNYLQKVSTYLPILKAADIDLLELARKPYDIETCDDELEHIVRKYNTHKYISGIISNKYTHLLSDLSIALLKEFKDMDISQKQLKLDVSKKIARLKSPNDLYNVLSLLMKKYNNFDMQSILDKKGNTKVVHQQGDDVLILQVSDYQDSYNLGSSSWCISYDKSYFEDYLKKGDEDNIQFFVYNFAKTMIDPMSIIGITIRKNGDFYVAYDKYDNFIKPRHLYDYLNIIEPFILKNNKN